MLSALVIQWCILIRGSLDLEGIADGKINLNLERFVSRTIQSFEFWPFDGSKSDRLWLSEEYIHEFNLKIELVILTHFELCDLSLLEQASVICILDILFAK